MYTRLYTLAMITTLMPHLRIGPYKEGVLIAQIQMPFTQLDVPSLMSSWYYQASQTLALPGINYSNFLMEQTKNVITKITSGLPWYKMYDVIPQLKNRFLME